MTCVDLSLANYGTGTGLIISFGPRPMIRLIQEEVARFYDLNRADMLSTSRDRRVARPRQVAMYLCRELTKHSLPDIGRRFGGRDHSTIVFGIKQVKKRMREDGYLATDVAMLRERLAA